MSRSDRKAWRENKRANHRRNEQRRWDRKCSTAFGSLWVMPKQMTTGPESGNSYAEAKAPKEATGFIVIDDPVTKQQALSPEAIERARSLFDATIRKRSVRENPE